MELMGNNESITWETVGSVSSMEIIVESFKSVFFGALFFLLKVTLKANIWRLLMIVLRDSEERKQKYLQ